ncbi:hypothetical protein Pmani_036484 [Petrolisthes manimaculis]|uniref:PKD/REJ-like domain-containing protein n=1 Tax=Petrolisthes manimaculis TaxID=1843537 RepID=A0AAE1TPC9_9EUCA|nr:hypothetical protein Pmani_036484 [Petrolisthes manimaculis]
MQPSVPIPQSALESGVPVCVMDDSSSPVFEFSSGGFDPASGTSLDSCFYQCDFLGFLYIGVVEGSICFCSSTLEGLEAVGGEACTDQCEGGEACGGKGEYLNVYKWRSRPNITLAFRDYQGVQVEVEQDGSWTYVDISSDMDYILDFGDGSGQYTKTPDDTEGHVRYSLEGEYYITVTEPMTGTVVALQVTVYHTDIRVQLSCPELVSTGEPFSCTFLEFYGYLPTLVISSTETGEEQNYTIPAMVTRTHGNGFSQWVEDGTDGISSQSLNDCNTLHVLNTPVGEDEILAKVETWTNEETESGIFVHIYTVQEDCVSGGQPMCPADVGVRRCQNFQYLCGDTCQTDATTASSCPATNKSLEAEVEYTVKEVFNYGLSQNTKYSRKLPPMTQLDPHSYLGVGCVEGSGSATLSNSARIKKRATSVFGGHGDRVLTGTQSRYLLQQTSQYNFLGRFITIEGLVRTLGPSYNCTKPSVAPMSDFNGNNALDLVSTEHWVLGNKIHVGIPNGRSTGEKWNNFKCQTHTTMPSPPLPSSMGSQELTRIAVPFLTGAPIAIKLTVDDGSSTQLWEYVDEVPEEGLTHYVAYNAPKTGRFSVSGEAINELGSITFELEVEVVPSIVEQEWQVTTAKPWATPPGEVILDITCLGSNDPPWTANFTLLEDVNVPEEQHTLDIDPDNTATDGFTFSESFTFTLASLPVGLHTLKVNFSNEVSSVEYNVTVDIREAISEITTEQGMQLIPGGDLIPPGVIDGLPIFPSNVTIVFTSTAGKGEPEYWGLFDENDVLFTSTNTSDQPITYIFNQEGYRNLTMKAYSEAEGWVPAESLLSFKVLNKIQGLQMTDFGIISKPNEVKTFSAIFTVVHPVSCLLIDYNDGSPTEAHGLEFICNDNFPKAVYKGGHLTNPTNLTHVYMEENLYNVTVMAVDLLTSLRTLLPVVVGFIPCKAPVVWIPKNTTVPLLAPKIWRSMSFTVESDAIVECNGTIASRGSCLHGTSPTSPSLPRFLDYGIYCFTYRLQLLASKKFPLFRTAYTYIEIEKSPLQAVIIEGAMSKVSRGYDTLLDLDAAQYSQDPDWPEATDFTYTWFCRRLDTDREHLTNNMGRFEPYNTQSIPPPDTSSEGTGEGCFGNGPGSLEHSEGRLLLNTASLNKADTSYEIIVMLERDTRFAMAKVIVEVLSVTPPSISIVCADPKLCQPTFSGLLVNPSSRVALESICTKYCQEQMLYSWTITSVTDNPIQETRDCPTDATPSPEEGTGGASLAPDPCPPVIPTGKTSKDIAMSSTLFLINPSLDMFKLTLLVTTTTGIRGEYVMTLVLNKPPTGGTCEVLPPVGKSMVSVFKVTCKDWTDPEEAGIGQYTYFVFEETDGPPPQENHHLHQQARSSPRPTRGQHYPLLRDLGQVWLLCRCPGWLGGGHITNQGRSGPIRRGQ